MLVDAGCSLSNAIKMENSKNTKHDGSYVVFKINKNGISKLILPPQPALAFALHVNMQPTRVGICVIWTSRPPSFKGKSIT